MRCDGVTQLHTSLDTPRARSPGHGSLCLATQICGLRQVFVQGSSVVSWMSAGTAYRVHRLGLQGSSNMHRQCFSPRSVGKRLLFAMPGLSVNQEVAHPEITEGFSCFTPCKMC